MITIVIVEDDTDIQAMLVAIVESVPHYHCLEAVGTGTEAVEKVKELLPDVVIMDIGLPDISGIACVKALKPKCPNVEFMMCTIHDEDELVFESLKAGANSYILKKSTPAQIIAAIQEVHDGGSPMSSDIARKVLRKLVPEANNKKVDYHITPREESVLELLSKGHTYQEVADLLFISVKTLKKHIYNIYEKLHVDNKTEALNKFYGGYGV